MAWHGSNQFSPNMFGGFGTGGGYVNAYPPTAGPPQPGVFGGYGYGSAYNNHVAVQNYQIGVAPPPPGFRLPNEQDHAGGAAPGYMVPGYTVPPAVQQTQQHLQMQFQHSSHQTYQQPAPVQPPASVIINHMNQDMLQQSFCDSQLDLMKQLGITTSDDEDAERERRRQRKKRVERQFVATNKQEAEESKEPSYTAADLEAARQKEREENMKELENARKQLQEKLKEDVDLKEKMKSSFVDEMMRRQRVSGTYDMTSGTVFPFKTYDANDPVNKFSQAERKLDLTNKPWELEADCEYLRKAMKGVGTDEDAIINVITSRCNEQRQQLKKQFKTQYGRDLIEDLHSELSGDFRESVMALFVNPALYDAWAIKEAIYGPGTDESTLIEVLLTRTNGQIQEMKAVYPQVASPHRAKNTNLLDKDIADDTSGDFKRLLISAAQGNRSELTREQLYEATEEICIDGKETGMFKLNFEKLVDVNRCKTYAKRLYDAGEAKWGTDEEVFNMIFSTKSYYELRVIWDEYVKIAQRDIVNSIDRETSGDFMKGLRAIVMNVRCRPMFFAMKLQKAMKGFGTDDQTLIRIIVSRSEIDLVQIKKCFLELTKQTLWLWIKNDTSGDYKKLLLAIVGKD